MKEKITRLKAVTEVDLDPRFETTYNVNEDGQSLDIAILDKVSLDTDSNIPQLDLKSYRGWRTFSFSLNQKSAKRIISNPDVIKTKEGFFLTQFNLPFDDLLLKKNWLLITASTASTENNREEKNTRISEIEFFKEVEDVVTNVRLDRPGLEESPDQVLWDAIANHNLIFHEYATFIDKILCKDDGSVTYPPHDPHHFDRKHSKIRSPFIKSEEYNLIKFATDFYMLAKFELDPRMLASYGKNARLPYYDIIVDKIREDKTIAPIINIDGTKYPDYRSDKSKFGDCDLRADERLRNPIMIELIWNYWMEQGMLVQAMNVINLHFQNIKVTKGPSPLDRFHADPLRPMSHIIWGYIQDEQHRLSLPRRVSEYNHEYGLSLTGRAVMPFNPADARVKFLEAFHLLLNLSYQYFKESDDTTYIADAFPILTALREVHLLLAEGNHNAYGNLTWTARQEMMMQQYILARPEMREFLGGRVMVPYPETWMDRVDTMRGIMNWGGTSILHFYELAIHGEQVLISIRYGNWSDVTLDRTDAANWAQRFRNSIYRYIHAYRTVTGVDLSADKIQSSTAYAVQPAVLMKQRLLEEKPALFQQQRLSQERRRRA